MNLQRVWLEARGVHDLLMDTTLAPGARDMIVEKQISPSSPGLSLFCVMDRHGKILGADASARRLGKDLAHSKAFASALKGPARPGFRNPGSAMHSDRGHSGSIRLPPDRTETGDYLCGNGLVTDGS